MKSLSTLDAQVERLIETHDNTAVLSIELRSCIDGLFFHIDRYGRTPACLAAALGKYQLAWALIKLGGGDRVLDHRQMTAHDYLALTPEARHRAAGERRRFLARWMKNEIWLDEDPEQQANISRRDG